MMTNIYNSDLAIPVGEFLKETLEEICMTQVELSNRLGRPIQAINEMFRIIYRFRVLIIVTG